MTRLAIPRLGCGLDGLRWDYVKIMLELCFLGSPMKILVCNYQPPTPRNALPLPPDYLRRTTPAEWSRWLCRVNSFFHPP